MQDFGETLITTIVCLADIIWTFARMSLERASILMLLQRIHTMEAQKLLVHSLTPPPMDLLLNLK